MIFLSFLNDDIDSFQNGVDTIVNGCKTYGSTPSNNTPSAIVESIKNIYETRYNAGVSAGQGSVTPKIAINSLTPTKNCTAIICMYSWGANLQDAGVYINIANNFLEAGKVIASNPYTKNGKGKGATQKTISYSLKAGKAYTTSISTSGWGEDSGSFGGGINFIVYY